MTGLVVAYSTLAQIQRKICVFDLIFLSSHFHRAVENGLTIAANAHTPVTSGAHIQAA